MAEHANPIEIRFSNSDEITKRDEDRICAILSKLATVQIIEEIRTDLKMPYSRETKSNMKPLNINSSTRTTATEKKYAAGMSKRVASSNVTESSAPSNVVFLSRYPAMIVSARITKGLRKARIFGPTSHLRIPYLLRPKPQ